MANCNSIAVLILMLINVAVGVKGGSTIGALALDAFTFDKVRNQLWHGAFTDCVRFGVPGGSAEDRSNFRWVLHRAVAV